jgi:hypothetical protein
LHYAKYDESGKLISIGTWFNGIEIIGDGFGGVEITETEYNRLLTEIREKAALVNQLYMGEITLNAVPPEWQKEIQRRVNERIEWEGAADQQEISADEALNIILGGEDA